MKKRVSETRYLYECLTWSIYRAGVLHGHYVIDPANPYNNVMDRCDAWDDVSRQVGTFLRQELFSGISPSDGWQ
jgi:hypothetical protein